MNTTITIKYANGDTREFAASDALEQRIVQGDMFSLSTLHPATGDEVAKMYAGNPVAALGFMLLLRKQLEENMDLNPEEFTSGMIGGVNNCISHLAEELSSVADEPKRMQ